SIQTLLHVRFRTSSQAGMLFLAAGRRDFLLLELISGRLQVRLDLGSGERSLRSEKGIHLSDLAWHSIELTHNRHNVNMTLDRNFHTSFRMPGPDLELSVENGLFVGGAAGLNHPYLFNISTGFRGCIDEVVFNEHNLLSSLRPYSGYKSVHEVSLGCSPQFSATEEDSVSFFSSKAFITLPPWEGPQEGVFECELYPSAREEDGMVLFSSGNQGGFVAIEIKDGNLVATVGNGEGSKTELRSLTHVHSNHTWYPIQLHLLPNSVQLKVGEELIKATLSLELQVIQLKGPLFLGGLDEEAQGEAQRAGLMSAVSGGQKAGQGVSFKGCLREIRVNTQRTGLPHAAITKDITVGCNRGQATNALATTSPTNRPEFDVTTTRPITNNKKNPNFLMLRKLEVVEGGWASLEPKHIRVGLVNLDFRKLGIHPSQLMFRIEGQPVHGQLRLDLSPDPNGMPGKGQERTITIGAEEVDRTFSMLDLWQGRVMYVHSGSEDQYDFFMFSVFSSSKKKLPVFLKSNRLHRFDISISPANDAPVLSLPEGNLFTLLEKSKRQVGKAECLDATIMAVPLEHKLVNCTGLEVNQGGAAIITTIHLAVQVNVDDQAVKIRYDVTELPQYGELQRLHSSGDWKRTTYFSQKLLEKERIRYLSTYHGLQTQNNITDYFKCKISIGSTAAKEVVFLIRVHWIQFKVTRSKMEVNGVQTAAVTPEDLHVISKGVKLNESDLYFRLLTVPNKGQLFLDNKVLVRNSTFSQKNITDGLMKYELLNMLHDDTRDTFSFQVFSAHANSTTYDFRINIHAESTVITVVNKGLSTLEGGSKVINKEILFTHTASNQEVHYSITVSPRHGQIRRINLSNSTSINDNIVTFTNQDIIEERIMYVHDDSETKQDSFNFQIMVYKPHKRTSKKEDRNIVEHTFNISVQLVNDQRPVRVVDKVFHVARNGQRLVTLTDIRYRDDDSDFQDNWLVYTRRGIPMGELVLASDTSHKLYEFTQRDLQQKKVLFVHRGVSFGRFVLFVSDGKHYVSTLLEVMAQDPYLQVENNTGIVVKRGGLTTMTSANLSIFSNLDIRDPQEVTFEVFLPPKHGVLCFNNGSCETVTGAKPISIFTQQDLVAGRLAYRHDSSHELSDGFNVTTTVHLDIGVMVKIYLESHQRPPTVISNRPVVVAEGQNVSISKEHLEVICLLRSSMQGFTEQPTNSFTQEDLNQGMIIYHQQSAGHTNDSVLLEATNGLTKVGPIRLEIDIIPMLLPLQVQNECLDVRVANHHFSGMNFLFLFEQDRVRINLLMFARRSLQVEREYISYIHDGSDTLRDNFTIVANQTEIRKHSLPCTAHISVIPVNDETPVVTTNKGLKVWVGSVTEITKDDLRAEDLDTPESEGLEFIITPPSNGHLALKSAPSRHILNFTQNHIETRQLMFVHSGASSGGVFYFNVTDGHHRPLYKLFSLEVMKPSVSMVNNTGLSLVQGRTAVILTTNRFAAQTNSRTQAIITYTVTTHPRHGRIAINDQEVTTFSHEDLEFGRVVYHMTDFSESEDSFQVSVSASSPGVAYGNVTGQTVNVTVRALIYLREPVRVPSGIAVKLGKAMIDASELARISRADPVFEVLSPPKHGKLVKVKLFIFTLSSAVSVFACMQMTYDPNRASQVLTSFTFRDVVQGRVAIEETLSDGDSHAPATPLNDSFIFLLKAGNVQPAKGELHFTILPHHQMHHGPSSLNTEGASHEHTTTWLPTHNKTTTGRGGGRGGPTTLTEVGVGLPPHILSHKNHNRTQHKLRPNTRWGNHTSSGSHGGRSGSHSHVPQPHTPSVSDKHGPAIPPDIHPVHVEVLPRPASDPLHIILPLLACLFLIIILVILILVFRRRKEKQARLRLLQQLATVALHTEDSPYLGRAERSVAMPSVVVTPLCPVSCPSSPRVLRSPRRSLAPGMTFWGPFEADGAGGDGNIRGDNNNERGNVTAGFRTSLRSRSLTPTLKDNQYWV
uniref:Laminin G domain-containing protein n=1 Tax=Sander lucioperca TaxID=283035 RepID=A0A8C9XC62_SANLU